MNTTLERVRSIVYDLMGEEVVETTTFKSIDTEYLDMVEIIMAIEEEFDLSIPDDHVWVKRAAEEEWPPADPIWVTIADAIKYVKERLT